MRAAKAVIVVAALSLAFAARAPAATPVDAAQCAAMKAHHVLNDGAPLGCARLAAVRFAYVDFSGRRHDDGILVVLDALAPSVERIFATLYARGFAVAKAAPMEAYDGDDNAAMADNNTSSFNHRTVAGTGRLSLHAYGAAIDLNPVQNPFLTRSGDTLSAAPSAGSAFLARQAGPGVAEAVVDVFAENGFFEWGGAWHDPIDYQHFDIGRRLTERLARLPADQARTAFAAVVGAYQHCMAQTTNGLPQSRRQFCARQAVD